MNEFALIEKLTQRIEEIAGLLDSKVKLLAAHQDRMSRMERQIDELEKTVRSIKARTTRYGATLA